MKGVEILTSYEIAIEYAFNWDMFWILFMTVSMLLVVIVFGSSKCDSIKEFIGNCFLIIFLGSIVGCAVGFINGTPIEYETRYKVTLSDEVSMSEFAERYEILEQDGKLYTIREIE